MSEEVNHCKIKLGIICNFFNQFTADRRRDYIVDLMDPESSIILHDDSLILTSEVGESYQIKRQFRNLTPAQIKVKLDMLGIDTDVQSSVR